MKGNAKLKESSRNKRIREAAINILVKAGKALENSHIADYWALAMATFGWAVVILFVFYAVYVEWPVRWVEFNTQPGLIRQIDQEGIVMGFYLYMLPMIKFMANIFEAGALMLVASWFTRKTFGSAVDFTRNEVLEERIAILTNKNDREEE